jgi:hypothetical protein
MLCLDSKLLTVTAQCVNVCRANYCTVYLQSPQFMWNRKIFSSLIMLTTLLVPLYCNNKTSTWIIVWDHQWINSVTWTVHSDHNSVVMSPNWMWQNHKITQCKTSHKTCITSGGKQTAYTKFSYCGVKVVAYITTSLGGGILHFDTHWFKSSGMLCHTEWYTVLHFTLSSWHTVAFHKTWIFINTIVRTSYRTYIVIKSTLITVEYYSSALPMKMHALFKVAANRASEMWLNDCCATHLKTQHFFFLGTKLAVYTATIKVNITRSRWHV